MVLRVLRTLIIFDHPTNYPARGRLAALMPEIRLLRNRASGFKDNKLHMKWFTSVNAGRHPGALTNSPWFYQRVAVTRTSSH
jgi:hypothetical protein